MASLSDLQITRIEEMTIQLPLAVLGVEPTFVAAHRAWLSPQFISEHGTSFPFVTQSWIAHAAGLNIVVDPCHGRRD